MGKGATQEELEEVLFQNLFHKQTQSRGLCKQKQIIALQA